MHKYCPTSQEAEVGTWLSLGGQFKSEQCGNDQAWGLFIENEKVDTETERQIMKETKTR